MNTVKLNELIKNKKIVIPLYLLKMCNEFDLTKEETLLLLYLYDMNDLPFNPEKIASDLSRDMYTIMDDMSNLSDKGYLTVTAKQNDKGVIEEVINLDNLYDKITLKIMEELNTHEEKSDNIHEIIELEFNRKLTPLEHEVIDDWEKNNYDKSVIKEAIKEASINGVNNLRYIDKILYDWQKKGIKSVSDIKKAKDNNIEELDNVYVMDDWLNMDDDE